MGSTQTLTASDVDLRQRDAMGIGIVCDGVGVLLWVTLIVWVVLTARSPDAAAPVRDLLLVAGATYVLARLVTRLNHWVVPAAVAGVAALLAVWQLGGQFSIYGTDPLGYANASAALYLVGCTAALMVVGRAEQSQVRSAAICAAVVCALVPWLDMAIAAALLMAPLPIALLSRELALRVRTVITAAAVVAIAALIATVAIGAIWTSGGPVDVVVAQTLSGNRARLWQEALDLAASAPVYGVGVNRFSVESSTAAGDEDLRWAHNEYLQLAAETGLPGLAFAVALLLWLFVRLAIGARDKATAVAAAGLAAASIAASIDYVWHFPVVVVALAAVVGAGGGVRRHVKSRSSLLRHGESRVDAASARDALWPQQLHDSSRQNP